MKEQRYILQKSETQSDGWVLTDKETQLVCQFHEHKFNETRKFTFLDSDADVLKKYSASDIARFVNELTSWGATFHYNILMPEVDISARYQVGREIAYYRTLAGMSQRELAERSGVNHANIAKIETGKYNASIDIVDKISSILGVRLGLI